MYYDVLETNLRDLEDTKGDEEESKEYDISPEGFKNNISPTFCNTCV